MSDKPAFPSNQPTIYVPDDLPNEWRDKIAQIVGQIKGMTLREYAAIQAMQGMLAHSCDKAPNLINEKAESVAKRSVEMADALLKELDKEQR